MQVNLSKKEISFLMCLCACCVEDFFDIEHPSKEDERLSSLAYNLHNRFENILIKGDKNGRI